MARYDAQINILLSGQRRLEELTNQLYQIEDSITRIQRGWQVASANLNRATRVANVFGRTRPRGEGGRFAPDPNRRERLGSVLAERRARTNARLIRFELGLAERKAILARREIENSGRRIQQAEQELTLQSRLNSAITIFQRQQRAFARGGGGARLPEAERQRAADAQAAFRAAGGPLAKNLQLVQALSKEMTTLAEAQREIGRGSSISSKGFEAGRRLQERIDVISRQNVVPPEKIRRLRSGATEAIAASFRGDQQEYSEALRRASAAVRRVERQSNEVVRETRRIASLAPRSPVRGGINFPGSPIAVEEELKKGKVGYPSMPVGGTKFIEGSPEWNKALSAIEQKILAYRRLTRAEAEYFAGQIGGGAGAAARQREFFLGGKALPDEKMLNAVGRGIKRLKTDQDQFNESVASGTRFQQKYNQEQERLRKIYGTSMPAGVGVAASRGAGMNAAQQVYRTGEFSPVGGRRQLTSTLASGAIIEQSLINLQRKGVDVTFRLLQLQDALNNAKQNTFEISLKSLDALSQEVSLAGKYAQLQRQILAGEQKAPAGGYPSSPIRGGVNLPGSPIFNETPFLERRFGKRGSAAISEGLIGGAFPLLFGQGAGAAAFGGLGGALGGFAGGGLGFGLSLIGTALGTVFDQLNQAAQETGKSLNYPIEGFEKLKEAGLFASRQQEYYISKLIESGRTTEATAQIQAEMIRKIGVSGVNDLMRLGDASSDLSKAWAEFNLQLQRALAGPMAGLLEWLAGVIGYANQVFRSGSRREQIIAGLSEKDRKAFFAAENAALSGLASEEKIGKSAIELVAPVYAEFEKLAASQAVREAKSDPKQQEAALQAQRQVADQIKSAYREGFQLQQQAIDLQRQGADMQRKIAEDIFNRQQQILRSQVENDKLRKQIAIETVDLEYRKRIANEEGRAAEVMAAEAELMRTRAEGEAEIESKKRLLELDIAKQKRDTENYVFDLNREIDGLRRATLNYEMQVADYRLGIERQIQDQRRIEEAAQNAAGGGGRGARSTTQGAFDTGLRTGPSGVIGGSAAYHQDISFGPGVGLEKQRELMVSLAKAYDSMGRKIELSNSGVAGRVFPLGGTVAEQNKFITDALAAHRARNGGTGRSAIDFYTPLKSESRFGKSVENTAMYAPSVPGASLQYGAGGAAGASVRATKNGQLIYQLMHGRTDIGLPGSKSGSVIQQLQNASSGIRRPIVPMADSSAVAGRRRALDAADAAAKREMISLEEKLTDLREQGALQRLYEVARGPIELKQRREAVDLAKAELAVIRPMSQDRQEMALFETQATEKIKARMEDDRKILESSKLQGDERQKLVKALADGLEITKQQIELDRQALGIAQQRRFLEEAAALQSRLDVTGTGAQAGLFGGAASAYEAEMLRSGNAQNAMQLAELTRSIEIKEAVAGVSEELNALLDPANQVIAVADRIGGAFSDSFKGVISGSMTAQEALAGFFQSVADHFLDMASQIIAKWIQMAILNTVLKLFPGGGFSGGFGGPSGGFNLPGFVMPDYMSGVQIPGGSFAMGGVFGSPDLERFANGGMFTNSIVSSPTLFKFADGGAMSTGLMGEAGPEAIMPLRRGPGGRLGVDASGGGGDVNVTVNVDARGTAVEGNDRQGAELGRAISAAVQAELVKQKRPGGLLTK